MIVSASFTSASTYRHLFEPALYVVDRLYRLSSNPPSTPMEHNTRTYPTYNLGTAYLVDTTDIIDDLLQLGTHIDGDHLQLVNLINNSRPSQIHAFIELKDSYPTQSTSVDNREYVPPIDDWETARITVTVTTESNPTSTYNPVNTDTTTGAIEILIDRVDFQYTLTRYPSSQLVPTTHKDGTEKETREYARAFPSD